MAETYSALEEKIIFFLNVTLLVAYSSGISFVIDVITSSFISRTVSCAGTVGLGVQLIGESVDHPIRDLENGAKVLSAERTYDLHFHPPASGQLDS